MHKTVEQLHVDLIALIKDATTIPTVVRGNDNSPEENGVYASILLINAAQSGMPALFFERETESGIPGSDPEAPVDPEAQVKISASTNDEAVFSLQIYRDTDPFEQVRSLRRYLATPWGKEFLSKKGIIVKQISDPIDTDYLVGVAWVRRISLQITLGFSAVESRIVSTIVEIGLEVNGEEQGTVK